MNTFPSEWYHGSPLELSVLRAGSTLTPRRELARVFSHKPPLVSLDEVAGALRLRHNGARPGHLYRVLGVTCENVIPHPHSTMPEGLEWLTRCELRLEWLESTVVLPDEFLDEAAVARLKRGPA